MTVSELLDHLNAWSKLYENSFGSPPSLAEFVTYAGQLSYRDIPSPSPEISLDTYVGEWEELVEKYYGREVTNSEKNRFLAVIEGLPE